MNDVLLVQELQRQECLFDDLDGLVLSEGAMTKRRVEVFPFKHFLHDVEVLPVLKDVVHANDVRVLSIHQHFELVHE